MKKKGAFYFQLGSLKKPVIVFYLIVLAATIVVVALSWNTEEAGVSGLEMATMIFLLVIGCCSFRDDFLFLIQSGVGRSAVFQTHCLAYGLFCLLMSAVDTVLSRVLSAALSAKPGMHYESLVTDMLPQAEGVAGFLANWALLLAVYLFLIGFGYLLGVLSYRGGRKMTVLLAVGVPVLFFGGLPAFLIGTSGNPFLGKVPQLLFGSYGSTMATLLVLAAVFHGIGCLLQNRAQVWA